MARKGKRTAATNINCGEGVVVAREGTQEATTITGFARHQPPTKAQGNATGTSTSGGAGAEIIIDRSEGHVGLFAPTGAGKGRNLLIPTLLWTTDAVIALDVKGELARRTARWRREALGQRVCVLDPWHNAVNAGEAATLNPLDILDPDSPSLADDAYALAGLLIAPEAGHKEVYWDESAQSTVAGLIVHVKTAPGETDRSLRRVWQLIHGDDPIYDLAVLMDTCTGMHPYARAQIAGLLSLSADNTRSCILSVIRQHLRLFGSQRVADAVATTTIDLAAIRNGAAQTIYLVMPPSKLESHAALTRLWLSALMTQILDRDEAPAGRTLLLLDEIAQLGPMRQVTQAVTLLRSYGVRCVLALQSYAQLKKAYPDEHEVLMENLGTVATFGHSAYSMSRQMADALGDIGADRLFAMRRNEIAIRRAGERTRIVTRLDYLADAEFAGRFDRDPLSLADRRG